MTYSLNGTVRGEGRVQICYDGQCGSVCDYGWNQPDAKVICRQLGFRDGDTLRCVAGVGGHAEGSGGHVVGSGGHVEGSGGHIEGSGDTLRGRGPRGGDGTDRGGGGER